MSDYIFIFDLDSTITSQEILPEISKQLGAEQEKKMREITEMTMKGVIPFKNSFLSRIDLLRSTSVNYVNNMVANIGLNTNICNFINSNAGRCYVVTGNLDVWISGLMKRIGLKHHYYCSKAFVEEDHIEKVISVADKELIAKQFVQPMVVIGDGDNDAGIARFADISIGFGGVRSIAPSLLRNIDYAFYDDKRCADFLWKLL